MGWSVTSLLRLGPLALLLSAGASHAATRVVFTSEVQGDFASPLCEEGRPLRPSAFSARVAPALVLASSQGAVLLDSGGLFSVHGVARFAAEQDPEALAELAARLGYAALAVSTADLAAARGPRLLLWRALARRGVGLLATNLSCAPEAREVCEAMGGAEAVFREQGAGRVALLGVLRADALARIGVEEAAGLVLEAPVVALARATRRARAEGAALVVAVVEGPAGAEAATHVLELGRLLPDDARPDLLVASRAGQQLLFARTPEVRPAIVASPPGAAVDVQVRGPHGGDLDLLARPLPEPREEGVSPMREFLAHIGPAYCAVWGRGLPGGRLARPIDGEGLLHLAAGAARMAAHAEVAIVNRGALKAGFRPARPEALSASDIHVFLPYDEPIDVADVSGDWLQARARSPAAGDLLLLGVSPDAKSVGGRPLEARATYRVATLRFLARGGDAALPAGPAWEQVPGASLRSTLLGLLERPSPGDPRDGLLDPAESVVWTFRPDLDARLAVSSISNPGASAAAPLQRRDTLTLGGEANLRAMAEAPGWAWENAAVMRVRSTRSGNPTTPDSVNRDDLEALRSSFTLRRLLGAQAWYLPQPYAEGYVETESASSDGVGSRRWLARGSLGLRLALHPKLSVKAAAAVERALGGPDARTLLGLNAQLALAPWELARLGTRRVELEAALDGFAGGATAQVTLRGHAGLLVDLIGPLALVLSTDFYAERDGAGPFGTSVDTSAGLRVRLLERFSAF